MRITTKSRYAMRAIVDIAKHQGPEKCPVRRVDTGERQGFSEDYLEQLLVKLRHAGIVVAVRGPGGGYRLAKEPAEITAWDIVVVVETKMDMIPCTSDDPEPDCALIDECPVKYLWRHIKDSLRRELENITVQDILDGKLALEESENDISVEA